MKGNPKLAQLKYQKRPIQLTRRTVTLSGSRTTSKNTSKKAKDEKPKVRGAEVSVRQSASPGQIVYGKMKVGGVYTFLETSNNAKAFMRTGEDDFQIVWIAKQAGATGNDISVTLVITGTATNSTVAVSGKAITIRVKSLLSASLARANDIIALVNGNPTASALVTCHKGEGDGTSYVAPVAETFLDNGGGTRLHQIITLAAHKLDGVDSVLLDKRKVSFGYSADPRWSIGYWVRKEANGKETPLVFFTKRLGRDNQTAIEELWDNLPTRWSEDHRQRGCAHAYLIFVWDEKRFAQGLPEVSFLVRGKPLYDPRDSSETFGGNAALVIADYLTNTKWGLGVSWADIDTSALIEASNVCDEPIELADGSYEKRYQIHGAFDTSMAPYQVLNEMADAIAGDIVYQAGKWRILPGKWRASSLSLSITEAIGAVTVTTRRSRSDTFNCVRGTYSAQDNDYEETDFPAIKVQKYITEDGREIYEDLALNFVTSATQAQRIARIRLGQIRQPIIVEGSFSLKALQTQVGDVIQYTDPLCGWEGKEFEVRSVSLEDSPQTGLGVKLILCETAEEIYTWTKASQLATDPAPNSNFPDHSDITAPTNVTLTSGTSELYIREDGTIFSRLKVAWTASTTVYVVNGGSYEVQYKRTADSSWSPAVLTSAENTYVHILDVKDGVAYDVRVRAISAIGVGSDWTVVSSYTVIGKTEPPSDVSVFGAVVDTYGIELGWKQVLDIDVREYEIRVGGTSWAEAAFLHRGSGSSFRPGLRASGEYTFRIKAVDTSGNYSANATSVAQTIDVPAEPLVEAVVEGADVRLSWTVPSSQFGVDYYELSYGDEYENRTIIGTVKGTSFRRLADYGGLRRWWVVAIDVAGNVGIPGHAELTIDVPSAVLSLTTEVIDSYVKLDWDEPATSTLPVSHYIIKKGADFNTAALVGQVSATFSLLFETIGGSFSYWVAAVDTAGNIGLTNSTTTVVNNPPDLTIVADNDLDLDTFNLANMTLVNGALLGPVDTSESWATHFTNNSFTTPQDQVTAGYPLYPQPGPSWCGAQKIVDFGALLPAGYIKAAVNISLLAGTPDLNTFLWYSPDGTTWTGGTEGSTISSGISFRYVKIRLTYGTVPNGTFT